MNRVYELMFIVDPQLGEEASEALIQRIRGYLEANDGTIIDFRDWGMRRLAYAINRKREGHYYLVYFSTATSNVKEIEHNILLAEGVMREMIVLVEEKQAQKLQAEAKAKAAKAEKAEKAETASEEPQETAPTSPEEVSEEA